jgi:predicted dehydrogenase/threonine dehydrogenase-like Zn-dependent dehydrogenase
MKQILIKSGKTLLENVPVPKTITGTVLVKVSYSCISQGTEIAGIQTSGKSKAEKIISIIKDKPQAIQKVIDIYKEQGFSSVYKKYKSVTKPDDTARPTGYSLSGIVEKVGDGITEMKKGDRVACAGAGIANHAEYVVVPRNLVMKIPDNLDMKLASTVTLGGIAMQGVRRGDFKIGEYVAVIGLGFLGQLTVHMLTASGCRVIAMDIDDRRCEIAKKHGAEIVLNSKDYKKIEENIIKISNGYGVDGVIFTAATDNPEVISSAFKMCKRKGKVILVGVAGDKINRQDLYAKELDFLISTSYGPGRYDDNYELKGIDYPYAYVRWTENRNMEEYLRLLSSDRIQIDDIIENIYEIENAKKAYRELQNIKEKPIIALFKYNEDKEFKSSNNKMILKPFKTLDKKIINVAIIGAGGFAKNIHLPNLQKMQDKYNIYTICDINSLNAKETAKKFNANIATTDYEEILKDNNVDLVMICTRHNLHAEYSIKALKADKAVFVEKPMAINQKELDELVEVIQSTKQPYMVGFNRRFSPFAKEIKKHISNRINPMIISYRMNAGYILLDAWVHEDGGRIIGEGCHIIDLFSYLTGSEIISVSKDKVTPTTKAISSTDNVSINLKYENGSIANLIYTALGNSKYPKENLELYCDNNIYKMTDYLELEIFGDKIRKQSLKEQDKGHLQELIEFYDTLTGKTDNLPIELNDVFQTTKATFLILGMD